MPQPWLPGFCEYEDVALTKHLTATWFGDEPMDDPEVTFYNYIKQRQQDLAALRAMSNRFDVLWGVKSPLLLLHWNDWLRATHANRESVTLVVTQCRPERAWQSIERAYSWLEAAQKRRILEKMADVQERIWKALETIKADHVLDEERAESIRRYI